MKTKIIYGLFNLLEESEPFYVGATNSLYNRYQGHKSDSSNEKSIHYEVKVYKYIREIGFENVLMVEFEVVEYDLYKDVSDREEYWRKYYNTKCNVQHPGRTESEWHKQDIKGNLRKREAIECECGQSYTRSHKTRHLDSYAHKIALGLCELQPVYVNKTKRENRKTDGILCDCGVTYAKYSYKRHSNTQYHKKWDELKASLK